MKNGFLILKNSNLSAYILLIIRLLLFSPLPLYLNFPR